VFVLMWGFALMTKAEALVLAEVMRDTAHVSMREGRDQAEESFVVAVISASGSALGRGLW
jgi:hypothetical protein